ncbi:hypothetical protein [Phenylobacterium sp.]|nr:hypothetical protein [Phenylobacterium sp.]
MSLTLSIVALTATGLLAAAAARASAMIKMSMITTRHAGRRRTS